MNESMHIGEKETACLRERARKNVGEKERMFICACVHGIMGILELRMKSSLMDLDQSTPRD